VSRRIPHAIESATVAFSGLVVERIAALVGETDFQTVLRNTLIRIGPRRDVRGLNGFRRFPALPRPKSQLFTLLVHWQLLLWRAFFMMWNIFLPQNIPAPACMTGVTRDICSLISSQSRGAQARSISESSPEAASRSAPNSA